jgi:hypothetical protein
MSKLTSSVDDAVVASAKRYAKRHGVSVSSLVETYLAAVSGPGQRESNDPPVLRSVRGSLRQGDRRSYRKHLAAKYR